ncbi:MAG: GNAT family N-acetyltransferase [Acidobacteriia bacterium]|nr:GNAT family N-acetyltransferase [Terriglobia bacterium]
MPPEVIDIRQFNAEAFESLLEAESRAWNSALRWDYGPSRRLVATCLDDKRLSGYALRAEGELIGYSFFFYEGEKGLIGNLFIIANGEMLEPAFLLLKHVFETLLATPGISRVETQLPHFSMEELEPCFRPHQFESYVRRFMLLPLASRRRALYGNAGPTETPAAASSPLRGFTVVPWERKHDRAAAELVYGAYRGHVDAHINDQYSTLAGTTRLVENIVHQHGCGEMLPTASLVAIHQASGKLAAALALTAVRSRTAHIPQIAVAREFQAAGLGTVLMEASFQDLIRRGFEEVSLTVTELNAGAVRLYERLGFGTLRTFGAFTWNRR